MCVWLHMRKRENLCAFGVDQSVERGLCIFNEYINKCTRVAKGRDEVLVTVCANIKHVF